jgi:hypothetical protein
MIIHNHYMLGHVIEWFTAAWLVYSLIPEPSATGFKPCFRIRRLNYRKDSINEKSHNDQKK